MLSNTRLQSVAPVTSTTVTSTTVSTCPRLNSRFRPALWTIPVLLWALTTAASAATIDVNSTSWGDDGSGACTLWEAVATARTAANVGGCVWGGESEIHLEEGATYVTQGQFPSLTSSLTIRGHGSTLSRSLAAPAARFFNASGAQTTLTLHDLTLIGGIATRGGAIRIQNNATLMGYRLRLESNFAYEFGGAIYSRGTVQLTHATLIGNSSIDGGAIWAQLGTVDIAQSTFAYNSASNRGGALAAWSGVDQIAINNSTFSDNKAFHGGALFRTAAAGGPQDTVIQTTFAGNRVDLPGDGNTLYLSGDANLKLAMSALHSSSSTSSLCAGELSLLESGGHNAATDASCRLDHADDYPAANFTLGELVDNGAYTQVRVPRCDEEGTAPCSILIDQYPCAEGAADHDQRGVFRREFGGASIGDWTGLCDIGAYESICHASGISSTGLSSTWINLIYPDQYRRNGTVLNSGACAGVGKVVEIPEEHADCSLVWQVYYSGASNLRIKAIWFLDDTQSCEHDCYMNPELCKNECTLDPSDWTAPLAGLGLTDPANGSPDPVTFTLASQSCELPTSRYVMEFTGGITDFWDPEVTIKSREPPSTASTTGVN